jgi:hypothetical protein
MKAQPFLAAGTGGERYHIVYGVAPRIMAGVKPRNGRLGRDRCGSAYVLDAVEQIPSGNSTAA